MAPAAAKAQQLPQLLWFRTDVVPPARSQLKLESPEIPLGFQSAGQFVVRMYRLSSPPPSHWGWGLLPG